MRILYIGDVNRERVRRWVKYLIGRGHDVTVLTHKRGELEGAKTLFCDRGDSSRFFPIKIVHRLLYWLNEWRLVKLGGFDLVHVQFLHSGVTVRIAAMHKRALVSIWGDGLAPSAAGKHVLQKTWVKSSLARVEAVTVVHAFLEPLLREASADIKRLEVIPFGADIKRFGNLKKAAGPTVKFCYAKHFEPIFCPDVMIAGFKPVIHRCRNASLVMIGLGDLNYIEELKRRTYEEGISRRIHFAGRVTESELDAHFADSSVFVAPYRWEVLPVVVLEAMASGLPVIATRVGGMTDVVIDGITGLTVPPDDTRALTDAMIWLYQDRSLRERMGRNAKEMAQQLYNFEFHAERMEGLYEEILGVKKTWPVN